MVLVEIAMGRVWQRSGLPGGQQQVGQAIMALSRRLILLYMYISLYHCFYKGDENWIKFQSFKEESDGSGGDSDGESMAEVRVTRRSAAGRSCDHVGITASEESDGSGGDSDGESVAEVRVTRRSAAGRSCDHVVITASVESDGSGGDCDGESVADVRVTRRSAAGRSRDYVVITASEESDGSRRDSDGESVAEVRVTRRSAAGRSRDHVTITASEESDGLEGETAMGRVWQRSGSPGGQQQVGHVIMSLSRRL